MAEELKPGGKNGPKSVRLSPPRMSRSQPQLATKYAPGSVFTWEGGRGACISVPLEGTEIDFGERPTKRDQIIDTLHEFCLNWISRGLNTISPKYAVYDVQLLDRCFHVPTRRGSDGVSIALEKFAFLRPEKIGYVPGPLAYTCATCKKVKEYLSPAHQMYEPLSQTCNAEGKPTMDCKWQQADVVFVHWSGRLEALSPFRYTQNDKGEIRKINRCKCGSVDFRLERNGSNHFSRWRFVCMGCRGEREVFQTDPDTLEILKPQMDAGVEHQWSEINMLPVSYRASSAYYVQAARFIVHDSDPEVISLMQPNMQERLLSKVASLHGFEGAMPSDEDIKRQLDEKGRGALWAGYQAIRDQESTSRKNGQDVAANALANIAQTMRDGWYATGDIVKPAIATPQLRAQVQSRAEYARRFDPIRSTVEHDALKRRRLDIPSEAADLRRSHADLSQEHGDAQREAAYQERISRSLELLGIQEMKLIRHLDMIEFSFGYTRVSSNPTTKQKDRPMPVKLLGFPRLPDSRHPIYVIEQQNEALYCRLDPDAVGRFLIDNGVMAAMPPTPRTLGSVLIEGYSDFGMFLEQFAVRDEVSRCATRSVPSMVYMLLHTLAHHVMHGIAKYSGLELGSLGEVIFPADLAFIVHRRGMTEDLGNISSMWRDHNSAFLGNLSSVRELRCGSGTLCDHRGGACPACIMVPETTCVAGNQLLSRSALIGGRAPLWDLNSSRMKGLFEVTAPAIKR